MKGFDVGKKLELLHPLRWEKRPVLTCDKNGARGYGDGGKAGLAMPKWRGLVRDTQSKRLCKK